MLISIQIDIEDEKIRASILRHIIYFKTYYLGHAILPLKI